MNEIQDARNALIGGMLLGRYRVVRELAKGGMGVVYLARVEGAVGFVKPVVVKLILPEHASDERFLRMFAREAQIVSQLRHPSVVDVLEFAEQDGAYVMVLEYVRGHHLGQWRRFLQLTGRQIPAEIAMQITIDVLDALHHAHILTHPDGTPMHIVHRDISPSNLLLDEDGRARLLDFGVARMRGGAIDYQTQVNGFVGKLTYTAPEIFEGNEASARSDLYSCAVVLHETLLGHNAFKGENQAETMQRALMHAPEAIASLRNDIPPGFDAVLAQALAKAPGDRYANCRDFCNALRELMPVSESEAHVALASMLKHDFGPHMAELLGIESLAERDEAWRRVDPVARRKPLSIERREEPIGGEKATEATKDRRVSRTLSARDPEPGASVSPGRAPRNSARTVGGLGPSLAPEFAAGAASVAQQDPDSLTAAERPRSVADMPYVVPLSEAPVQPAQLAPVNPSPAASARRSPAPPSWGLLLVVMGATALAAAAIVLRHDTDADQDPPAAGPSFRVVATPAPAPVAVPAPVSAVSPQPPTEPPSGTAPNPDPGPAPGSKTRAHPANPPGHRNGPDPLRLTLAFREQQSKIEACFAEYPKGLVTQPEIEVEFDLEASGHLNRARVLPKAFASSPLGACVARVAAATKFPKQGRAVSFTIPVHTSRGK